MRKIQWIVIAISIVVAFFQVAARAADSKSTIPAERTFVESWRQAGYPGDQIPSPPKIVDVRDFGARGDGKADDHPAVVAAIAALNGEPGVVFFPKGHYLIQSQIRLSNGVVLRGEGPEKSVLQFDFVTHAIWASAPQKGKFQAVVSGYGIHSDTIEVADSSVFEAGSYAEIQQQNDPAWRASGWARNAVGQILRVKSVDGKRVTFETGLRFDYQARFNPEIRPIDPVTDVGIEDLKVERLLAGDAKQRNNQFTIGFEYAARCWVRGVESVNAFGGHIGARSSTQLEVTGCYLHHAHEYDGGGSGYGVRLEIKTGDCLVEDNIFQSLRHAMLMQAGANGNVFGYNYSFDSKRTEPIADLSSDITFHGNHPYANLIEGNICQHIQFDASHGANGPLNTIFRNRAKNYGINITDPLAHRQNIVGNETFTGKWTAFVGNGYSLRGEAHFEFGNLTKAAGLTPEGTEDIPEISLYRPAESDPEQPAIGPPGELDEQKTNPARERFLKGGRMTIDRSR